MHHHRDTKDLSARHNALQAPTKIVACGKIDITDMIEKGEPTVTMQGPGSAHHREDRMLSRVMPTTKMMMYDNFVQYR